MAIAFAGFSPRSSGLSPRLRSVPAQDPRGRPKSAWMRRFLRPLRRTVGNAGRQAGRRMRGLHAALLAVPRTAPSWGRETDESMFERMRDRDAAPLASRFDGFACDGRCEPQAASRRLDAPASLCPHGHVPTSECGSGTPRVRLRQHRGSGDGHWPEPVGGPPDHDTGVSDAGRPPRSDDAGEARGAGTSLQCRPQVSLRPYALPGGVGQRHQTEPRRAPTLPGAVPTRVGSCLRTPRRP